MDRDRFIDWFGGPIVLAVVILVALGLLGCGGSGSNVSTAPITTTIKDFVDAPADVKTNTPATVENHKLQDYYWITNIRMPSGITLTCIEAYEYQDGGPTLSCNWEAYNQERR